MGIFICLDDNIIVINLTSLFLVYKRYTNEVEIIYYIPITLNNTFKKV